MERKHTEHHHNEIKVAFIAPKKWTERAKWELLEEYESHNGNVTVPVGFISDGATIFWALRWLFSPTGKYFGATIIHDYIIEGEGQGDWDKANKEFEEEMHHLSVDNWMKSIMVWAVKLWTQLTGK